MCYLAKITSVLYTQDSYPIPMCYRIKITIVSSTQASYPMCCVIYSKLIVLSTQNNYPMCYLCKINIVLSTLAIPYYLLKITILIPIATGVLSTQSCCMLSTQELLCYLPKIAIQHYILKIAVLSTQDSYPMCYNYRVTQ